jgi:hypothetical protein
MFPFFRMTLSVMLSASANAALYGQVLPLSSDSINLPTTKAEGLVVALRVDVRPLGREAIEKVLCLGHIRQSGVQFRAVWQEKSANGGCGGSEKLAAME